MHRNALEELKKDYLLLEGELEGWLDREGDTYYFNCYDRFNQLWG